MYIELNFQLTEVARQRLFNGRDSRSMDYRSLIAKLSDEYDAGLPSALFHYENGKPAPGLSPVRFSSHPKGLRLIGIGVAGVELLTETAADIQALFVKASKTFVACSINLGSNRIIVTPYERQYHASTIVVGDHKRRHQWRAWQKEAEKNHQSLLDIPEARQQAERALTHSLRRQLTELHAGPGDDTGINHNTGEHLSHRDMERLQVKVVSFADLGGVPPFGALQTVHARHVSSAPVGALALLRPVVSINAELVGRWGLGILQARGYGLLWRHWTEEAANQEAA
ncbi:MAG: hypothetical protein JNM52_08580 [Betaproteobacteria bacterium]|nr:hypothetical protein [Betaproteobacteria bacterium]